MYILVAHEMVKARFMIVRGGSDGRMLTCAGCFIIISGRYRLVGNLDLFRADLIQ